MADARAKMASPVVIGVSAGHSVTTERLSFAGIQTNRGSDPEVHVSRFEPVMLFEIGMTEPSLVWGREIYSLSFCGAIKSTTHTYTLNILNLANSACQK